MQNFYAPPLTKINKILIYLMGGLFVLQTCAQLFQNISLMSYFGLSLSAIQGGFFYTLITFPLFQTDLMSGLFSALIFWYTGSELEMSWGSKKYLQFLVSITIFSGLFFLIVVALFFSSSYIAQMPLVGSSGLCFGLLIAYAMIYPERYFSFFMLFPMKAMHFCMLLGAVQLYTAMFSPVAKTTWGHLAAMGIAYLYLLVAQGKWKNFRRTKSTKDRDRVADLKKIRHPHLFLVKEDDDDLPPSGGDGGGKGSGGGPNHRNWH
ncbi:MAG: rhomboid family intramembrane serine protease [Bacteriovoracaceae bacterium]|nr:rhomboid family intramembrane serine protease [Bacteriovoracaceae bacterium]